ncbi:MAG: hypothetical protein IPM78_14090 [Moraxellaceae bacterium]|nr:hypothetical protein [Moraxellaceae bacterium]
MQAIKSVVVPDERELYSERVRAIRWFEKNALHAFDLYGIDWDLPPPRAGLWGKITKRLWRYVSLFFGLKPFTSYRGKVEHKRDVLLNTRYAICYENVRDLSGYITEKIFDCFLQAAFLCIGAQIISLIISLRIVLLTVASLKIRLRFISINELVRKRDFIAYQQRIAHFLQMRAGSDLLAQIFLQKQL